MEKEGKGKGSLKPERLTRAAARDAEANEAAGGDEAEAAVEEGEQTTRPLDVNDITTYP